MLYEIKFPTISSTENQSNSFNFTRSKIKTKHQNRRTRIFDKNMSKL